MLGHIVSGQTWGKNPGSPKVKTFPDAGLISAFNLRLLIVNVREFNCQNLEAAKMLCNRCMVNCSTSRQ